MKLKPTSFYAMFPDGLVQLNGHAFDVVGRALVVHKTRPGNLDWDKAYKVSEATLGFGIPIPSTQNRAIAVSSAETVVSAISQQEWNRRMAAAAAHRTTLKVIGEK